MKKSVKIIAVAVAVIILAMSLMSCDLFGKKLNGEYEGESGLLGTFTFDGKNVEYSYKTVLGKKITQEGTYKIEDDEITFEWVDEDGEELDEDDVVFGGTYEFEEKDNGDIIIGEFEFEKAD